MANHMEEVAKILGVEFGKEFEVDYGHNRISTAKITNTGLKIINTNIIDFSGGDLSRVTLEWLLGGLCEVKHKHWKPKFEDEYFSIGVDGTVEHGVWLNDFLDYSLYKIGNCYRTIEEARANRSKWGAFYDSAEVLEV